MATNAHPEEVRSLFKNSRLIGRRFRLVHVFYKNHIIEVATFRAHVSKVSLEDKHVSDAGMLIRDNIFGSIEEDAERRDFSVNALYYRYHDANIIDFTEGLKDIEQRTIRVIGDPVKRYHEDPVRMIRAVRLAAKLNFEIEPESEKPIFELAGLLLSVPSVRLMEEIIKLYSHGKAEEGFRLLREHGLFSVLFPQTEASLINNQNINENFLMIAFRRADERVAAGKNLHPAFLFAVILWPAVKKLANELRNHKKSLFQCYHEAIEKVLRQQSKYLQISKRFGTVMREIWLLQLRLEKYQNYSQRIYTLFFLPRFRAAYDFLLIRTEAGDLKNDSAQWWTVFQNADEQEREKMIKSLSKRKEKK